MTLDELTPQMLERLDNIMAGNVPMPWLIAGALKRFSEQNGSLASAVSDKLITAERYLVAEFLSTPKENVEELLMRGDSPGTKSQMAALIGVSTQALHKYEKKYHEVLSTLRTEFAVATRSEFIALARAIRDQPAS